MRILKKIIKLTRIALSIRDYPKKIELVDVNPFDRQGVTSHDQRKNRFLRTRIRKGYDLNYFTMTYYKAIEIFTTPFTKKQLKVKIYQLIFLLFDWLEKIEEYEEPKDEKINENN